MPQLQAYYDEHASQARQHENSRHQITALVLAITGALVGIVTSVKLAANAWPAASALVVIGLAGYFAAAKYYERFRFHTSIMEAIRGEIERLMAGGVGVTPLSVLRHRGENWHYKNFVWPGWFRTRSNAQANAGSRIARARTHMFWELLHLAVVLLGVILLVMIAYNHGGSDSPADVTIIH